MTRDEMYDLILGAAVVAVGYMLWKQHKGAMAGSSGVVGPAIPVPQPIEIQGNDQDGYFYDLADISTILQGVV